MIVVCDVGPLHYLVLIGAEHVLPELFTRVLTPPVVLLEMSRPETPEPVRRWAGSPPQWLEVKQPLQRAQFHFKSDKNLKRLDSLGRRIMGACLDHPQPVPRLWRRY